MRSIITQILLFLLLILFIIFVLNLISSSNITNSNNTDKFKVDNINCYKIYVEPTYDGGGVYYYNVDLKKSTIAYCHNTGYIRNSIEIINSKKLTKQENTKLRELINNAYDTYIQSSVKSNYYRISNETYIYEINEVNELEQLLGK